MTRQEYITRRARLAQALPEGSMSFFFAGNPVRKSADTDYPFYVNRNYYYLTGIKDPGTVLVLVKTAKSVREYLFINPIDEQMEKWVGKSIRPSEAMEISGIHAIQFLDSFHSFISRNLPLMKITQLGIDNDPSVPGSRLLEADVFAKTIRKQYSAYPIFNTYSLVAGLRTLKSEAEVDAIRYACEKTDLAIQEMLKVTRPGGNERELQAAFDYALAKEGGREMFESIVAAGANGCVLHYVANDQPLHDQELVLFDLGGCYNEYGADISQTYPVNGTFTPRQKEVYTVVLDCFKAISAATKPGVSMAELNRLANDILGEGCVKLGLIDDKLKVRQYYFHGIGHSLGLDTHDIGFTEETVLAPGCVVTNEPGLYIEEEKIGIRIETDLLVTETGCVDLAPSIKREISQIEELMRSLR